MLLGGGRVLTGGEDGAVKLWAPPSPTSGGRLLRTIRPLTVGSPQQPQRLVVEAIACEEPDVFVLCSVVPCDSSTFGILSLSWFDLFTGRAKAPQRPFSVRGSLNQLID